MKRTLFTRIRLGWQEVAIAVLLSLGVGLYWTVFGSPDIEESTKISYSIAVDLTHDGVFSAPREVGTFSFLGVPLYDGLQGIGNRLPYQASWGQSPDWPLRFTLTKNQFLFFRIFVSSVLMLLSAQAAFKSWKPHASLRELVMFSFLLLSPAGLYLRHNEWSDTYYQTVAINGLVLLLARRHHFSPMNNSLLTLIPSATDVIILFGCTALLVTGHPGVYPVALFVILPIVIAGLFFSPAFRQNLIRTFRKKSIEVWLSISPAVVVVGVTVWELKSELSGMSNWSIERINHTQGFYSDQALRGFSRGILPDIVERTLSVVIATVFLPLIRILYPFFMRTDFASRMSGSFPRGEFAGILGLLAAMAILRNAKTSDPVRTLIKSLGAAQLVIFLLAFAAANDFLPLEISPSGAWQIFPIVLSLNLLLTFVVLSQGIRNSVWYLASLNALLTGIWVMMQFQLLSIHPSVHLTLPVRNGNVALSKTETQSASPILTSSSRAIFLTSDEHPDLWNWNEYIEIVQLGHSVVIPADPKIRRVNQLIDHSPTFGTLTRTFLTGIEFTELDRMLDFLEVEHVLIQFEDPLAHDIRKYLTGSISQSGVILKMHFGGSEFLLWTRRNFSSTLVESRQAVGSKSCPILERNCPISIHSKESDTSEFPRLATCSDPCLWKYRTEKVEAGKFLVVPVTFDQTLTVIGVDGVKYQTFNVGGFLGVYGQSGITSGIFEVSVRPDMRMLGRVCSSYLYLLSLVALILYLGRLTLRSRQ